MLRPLLYGGEAEAERVIDTLLARFASPVVERVLGGMARRVSGESSDAAAEIRSEIMLRLIERLKAFRRDPEERPIVRFQDYVAVVSRNAVDAHLRAAFPLRARLKGRIRYLLTTSRTFDVWTGDHGVVAAGLKEWRDQPLVTVVPAREPSRAPELVSRPLQEIVEAILGRLHGPVALDQLVDVVAEVTGELEERPAPRDVLPSHDDTIEANDLLRHLWTEIAALPVKQRAALLLNLRGVNGEPVVHFLPVTRVATVRQIAAAVEMDPLVFAELWDELPLDDLRLAELLDTTRQQVINLRKSARARLGRRMTRLSGGIR
ncbi:MAG TPA: hypothetical protein VE010_06385 [Thermoanaerobaculia bacterium]|nr:hypothetical protein [Thermoanaerobaculia bacterium]